MITTVYTELI